MDCYLSFQGIGVSVIIMGKNILDEVFKEPHPDRLLYHYTTQEGIKGIIEKKVLWCTHSQFMNDSSEFKYALRMLKTLIGERIKKERPDSSDRKFLERIDRYTNMKVWTMNVCVGSLSDDGGDSLSQWRAYGSANSGFSIGINGTKLAELAEEKLFVLARCIYDETRQNLLLEALIDKAIEDDRVMTSTPPETPPLVPPTSNIIPLLNQYAPLLKHPSFSEEREWRLISRPLSCDDDQYDHRLGKSMLIPYYKFCLEDKNDKFILDEVVIGPTPHPLESELSIHSLLASRDLIGYGPLYDQSVKTRVSKVPFRNW
jgi:hypothetical protein